MGEMDMSASYIYEKAKKKRQNDSDDGKEL